MSYKLLELTNNTIGAVAIGALLPLGYPTRSVGCNVVPNATFTVSSAGSSVVTINDPGAYKITYVGSFVAGAAGPITLNLTDQNGTVIASTTQTAAAVGDGVTVTLLDVVRVLPNRCGITSALTVGIALAGGAITGGTGRFLIEKVG